MIHNVKWDLDMHTPAARKIVNECHRKSTLQVNISVQIMSEVLDNKIDNYVFHMFNQPFDLLHCTSPIHMGCKFYISLNSCILLADK